jgi:hypothetical protein
LVAFAGLVLILYVVSAHLYTGASDKATTILQGQAMSGGNLLLHGWILTRDSYWTTDALLYALAVPLVGVGPALFNWQPAVVLAITIVAGARIASHKRRGGAGIAGAVTVVILLLLCPHDLAVFMLGPASHLTTALLALVAFAGLMRGRFDWRWAGAVAALALGMMGDFLMVAYGIVPVFVAGIVCMIQVRAWRPDLAAVIASLAATVVGVLASWLAATMGGFTLGPSVQVARFHQVLVNLRHLPIYLGSLLGFTNRLLVADRVPLALNAVHFVTGLIVVGSWLAAMAELVRGIVRGRRETALGARVETGCETESRWLDNVLLIATFGPVTTFVVLAVPGASGARYLLATLVFASVLSGRIVARAWQRLQTGWITRAICGVALAVSLCLAAGLSYTVARPVPIASAAELASFLQAHHLRNGVGDYWAASIITVQTSEAVSVRPVWGTPDNKLERSLYGSSASWYAGKRFQFLVYQVPAYEGVNSFSATNTWGRPAHTYVVGNYRVLVWSVAFSVAPYPPHNIQAGAEPATGSASSPDRLCRSDGVRTIPAMLACG